MKRPFKVGDRVRVTGEILGTMEYRIGPNGKCGEILSMNHHSLTVKFKDGMVWNVFQNQCRLLKPKKQPLTLWIKYGCVFTLTLCDGKLFNDVSVHEPKDKTGWRKFVEEI